MLDEIRTFVMLAEVGSLQRTASRLFLTPSAVTRQIQRLEDSLGAEVLDRRVKPPKITPIGHSILEQGRDLLRSFEELKASASSESEPSGAFRLGLAHGLAVAAIAGPLRKMTDLYPAVRPQLSADMTRNLLDRVRRRDLDAAVMLLPTGETHSSDLIGKVIAADHMVIAAPSNVLGVRDKALSDLDNKGWVLNPPGCLVRENLRLVLEQANIPLKVAAEVYSIDLQLALVSAGYGLGLFPSRALKQRGDLGNVRVAHRIPLDLPVSIAFVKAGGLGRMELAAMALESELSSYFRT